MTPRIEAATPAVLPFVPGQAPVPLKPGAYALPFAFVEQPPGPPERPDGGGPFSA